jgi:hypothetical protein
LDGGGWRLAAGGWRLGAGGWRPAVAAGGGRLILGDRQAQEGMLGYTYSVLSTERTILSKRILIEFKHS